MGGEETAMNRIHELLDRWTAETPDMIATVDHDDRKLSYQSLGEAVDEALCYLDAADVRPGDRMMLVAENATAFIAFVFAASRRDAWVVPVSARLTAVEIDRLRAHASPRAMVFTHRTSPGALAHARRYEAKEVSGLFGEVKIVGRLDAAPERVFEDARKQVAALIYTTGTTASPKGVMLTHGNLLFMSDASKEVRAMVAEDHVLGALPFTHIFACASAFLAATRGGGGIPLLARCEPEAVFKAMA
jgi:long-subunit acyl-CoA synthetase (AMP-forming)